AFEAVDRNLLPGLSMSSLEETLVRLQKLMIQTTTTIALLLACLALALAAVGIYGVMSYLVTQRTSEFGIRMALGATGGDVIITVVCEGLRPGLVGGVLGGARAGGLPAVCEAMLAGRGWLGRR